MIKFYIRYVDNTLLLAKEDEITNLDIDYKEFGFDHKRINSILSLQDMCMILKPGKGQRVVLIKKSNYKQSMDPLFSNQRKFKILNEDPIIKHLRTVQNYLNTLYNRRERTELEKKCALNLLRLLWSMVYLRFTNRMRRYQVFDQ